VRRLRAAVALGAVLTGCGGGDDSAALVERLPDEARALSAIDLAAVKERLGLPGDTDPTRPPGDAGGEAEARLFAYAGGAFDDGIASRLERAGVPAGRRAACE
jgi:hypothetical protein